VPLHRSRLTRSLSVLVALAPWLATTAAQAQSPSTSLPRERLLHRREAAAADRWKRYAAPAAKVPEGAWIAAHAGWEALVPGLGEAGSPKPPPPQAVWKELGPAPLDTTSKWFLSGKNWSPAAGRVTAIAVDPTDPKILYVGGAVGGVWKSTDGGATWKPLDDQAPSLAVGALALDPKDPKTLWVGTGSPEPYSGPYGKGILLSKDGGATWSRPAGDKFAGLSIARIVLDPDAGDMYAAVIFGGAGYGEPCTTTDTLAEGQGLYRSSDGGVTWTALLEGTFDDVEVDTSVTPRRIFADEVFVGPRRSADGGMTWAPPGGLPMGTERVQFTLAPSSPSTVYAGVGYQGEGSLWFSTDGGANFTEVPGVPSFCEGQCYFDDTVAVKPDDPNTVFLGGALCSVWKISDAMSATPQIASVSSLNGDCGEDFANWYLSYVHPDTHSMAFDPKDPETLYVGSDGGLSRTKDAGGSWEQLNDGVGTIQLYAVCADPNDPVRVYGGSQDNGAMVRREDGLTWSGLSTGDGAGCAVDAIDPKHALVSVNYGYSVASNDGFEKNGVVVFDTQKPYCAGLAGCGDRSSFLPPVAAHPTAPNTFFIGTYRLWRSLEGGKKGTWKAISDDVTGGPDAVQCVPPPDSGSHEDYLSAIGLAPSDPKVMYTGSAGGVIAFTTDDGVTWTKSSSPVLPRRWMSGFAVDPVNPKIVAAGYSGFNKTTPETPGHVFLSTDGGASWAPSGLGLDAPVNALVGHPVLSGVFYAATDFGVIASSDSGATWKRLGAGLARSPVYSLSFRKLTTSLIAGTHGRGAWEIAFVPQLAATPGELSFEAELGSNPEAQSLKLVNEERYGSVLTVGATSDAPWIEVTTDGTTAGGATSVSATVSVTAKGRAVGDYEGSITVTASAGMPATVTVPVHLHVRPKGDTSGGTEESGGGCDCTTSGEAPARGAFWAIGAAIIAFARRARRRERRH